MNSKKETGALLQLLKDAKSIRLQMCISCLLSLCILICVLIIPNLLGNLIQQLIDHPSPAHSAPLHIVLLPGLGALLTLYVAKSLCMYCKTHILNQAVSRYFTCNLRIKISDKVQRLPVSYADKTPVGDILSRMTDDVSHIGNSLHEVINTIMDGFLQIAAITVMLLTENWMLGLVVLLFTPLSIFLSSMIAKKSETCFHQMFQESGKLYAIVSHSLYLLQCTLEVLRHCIAHTVQLQTYGQSALFCLASL